jgi:segregation and condensation protein A
VIAGADVQLEVFEGPLDLLLHLIKKNDLDIADIPISQITSEYLRWVDMMKELRLDVAGEFLVMASTLMQIKARQLLPSHGETAAEGNDPRAELVNRLLEYQRFKSAAKELELRLASRKDVHFRSLPSFTEDDVHMDVSLVDLLGAFRDVLKNLKTDVREIVHDEVPLEAKIRSILDFMGENPRASFRDLLARETTRRGLIVTFLALLELIRLKRIAARQADTFGEIRLYRLDALPEEPAPPAAAPTTPEETHGHD